MIDSQSGGLSVEPRRRDFIGAALLVVILIVLVVAAVVAAIPS